MAKFTILKEYLKSLSFSSAHTPAIFFRCDETQSNLGINIDTRAAKSEEGLYDVTVSVRLSTQTKTEEIFNLSCEYSSIVTLNIDGEVDEESVRQMLMVNVPLSLYPIVRHLISNLTYNSGFPPITLQNFDFEQEYKKKVAAGCLENNPVDKNTAKDVIDGVGRLSYDTVVRSLENSNKGEQIIQTCLLHGMNPYISFKDTPMYKYLLRFIDVPNFRIPTYAGKEVDPELFKTLFRFVATDEKFRWRLEERDGELELFVADETDFDDKAVSDMDYNELNNLLTALTMDSWGEYNVELTNLFTEKSQMEADEYLEDLAIQNMPTFDEYMTLFCNFATGFLLNRDTVKHWYRKLEDIDLLTMKYRF